MISFLNSCYIEYMVSYLNSFYIEYMISYLNSSYIEYVVSYRNSSYFELMVPYLKLLVILNIWFPTLNLFILNTWFPTWNSSYIDDCSRWEVSLWSKCTRECAGVRRRTVQCVMDENSKKIKVRRRQSF